MPDSPILTGRTLSLRPFEPDDAPTLRAYLNHPLMVGRRYIPDGFPNDLPVTLKQAQEIIGRWNETKKSRTLAIIDHALDGVIGHIETAWWWDTHTMWIGLAINPDHWRHGSATDALNAALRYLFDTTVVHVIQTRIEDWNTEAQAFLTAYGFQPNGRLRRTHRRNGRFVDDLGYDLLRREWDEK